MDTNNLTPEQQELYLTIMSRMSAILKEELSRTATETRLPIEFQRPAIKDLNEIDHYMSERYEEQKSSTLKDIENYNKQHPDDPFTGHLSSE